MLGECLRRSPVILVALGSSLRLDVVGGKKLLFVIAATIRVVGVGGSGVESAWNANCLVGVLLLREVYHQEVLISLSSLTPLASRRQLAVF
jgi:hypothetical protein